MDSTHPRFFFHFIFFCNLQSRHKKSTGRCKVAQRTGVVGFLEQPARGAARFPAHCSTSHHCSRQPTQLQCVSAFRERRREGEGEEERWDEERRRIRRGRKQRTSQRAPSRGGWETASPKGGEDEDSTIPKELGGKRHPALPFLLFANMKGKLETQWSTVIVKRNAK